MPYISLDKTPLNPGISPVEIYYREFGGGAPLVFLHGGWGYEIYPFDRQIEALSDRFRIIIPDRSGYGRSMRLTHVPIDFHRRAAVETVTLLDKLKIERPLLWGHSDGAVIAALMALERPEMVRGLILEAFHFYRRKPSSRPFFETMAEDPRRLGERVSQILGAAHGEDYWQKLIVMNGHAWLGIADEGRHATEDLYDEGLSELKVPALFIHGSRDPRTEPGEMEAVAKAVGRGGIAFVEGGGHSPHSETAVADEVNRLVVAFLDSL